MIFRFSYVTAFPHVFIQPKTFFPTVRGRGGEVNGCPVVEPNHQWNGQGYIATWLINGDGRQVSCHKRCWTAISHRDLKNTFESRGHFESWALILPV